MLSTIWLGALNNRKKGKENVILALETAFQMTILLDLNNPVIKQLYAPSLIYLYISTDIKHFQTKGTLNFAFSPNQSWYNK